MKSGVRLKKQDQLFPRHRPADFDVRDAEVALANGAQLQEIRGAPRSRRSIKQRAALANWNISWAFADWQKQARRIWKLQEEIEDGRSETRL